MAVPGYGIVTGGLRAWHDGFDGPEVHAQYELIYDRETEKRQPE